MRRIRHAQYDESSSALALHTQRVWMCRYAAFLQHLDLGSLVGGFRRQWHMPIFLAGQLSDGEAAAADGDLVFEGSNRFQAGST